MGSIWGLEDDHPNLKNIDFSVNIEWFLKDRPFLFDDCLELLGSFSALGGFLFGALGDSLGLTSGALDCSSVYLGALSASFLMLLRPS